MNRLLNTKISIAAREGEAQAIEGAAA